MNSDYDYAIIGAGCSGLSLALELIDRIAPSQRLLVLDSRQRFEMDRLWCFWNTSTHRFETAVQRSWNRWKVRYRGEEIVHSSDLFSYHYLPADAYYDHAETLIKQASTVDLKLGTEIMDLEECDGGMEILTSDGAIRAGRIFDGRNNFDTFNALDCLQQQYVGQRVRSDAPVFTPDTVTLMDFDTSQHQGITFVYLLPFSETEALVEPTVIAKERVSEVTLRNMIKDHLKQRYQLTDYKVLFEEKGTIPMTTELTPARKAGSVVPIGTSAGMVRGSTGYGFLTIQRWNALMITQLLANPRGPLPKAHSEVYRWLDKVFLAVLNAHPEMAPQIFYRLFQQVPAERVVRFLTECASIYDIASVVASMPKKPFIRQALTTLVPI